MTLVKVIPVNFSSNPLIEGIYFHLFALSSVYSHEHNSRRRAGCWWMWCLVGEALQLPVFCHLSISCKPSDGSRTGENHQWQFFSLHTQHKSIKYISLSCVKCTVLGFLYENKHLEMQPSAILPNSETGASDKAPYTSRCYPSMVVPICHPSIWEAVAGTLPWAWGQPGLQSETMSGKTKAKQQRGTLYSMHNKATGPQWSDNK